MAQVARTGVLFVSHEASRTGAPIALLHFIRWFKKNGNRPFSILLLSDGDLTPDFTELGDTWAIDRSHWCPGGRRTSLLNGIGLGARARRSELAEIQRFADGCSPGLIYANSIASAPAIEMLQPRVPVLTHVHELKYLFRAMASSALSNLLAKTHQFIACSDVVKENLIREHGIAPDNVETVHESIPVDQVRASRTRQQVFAEMKIPGHATLIIGGGSHSWRKGADLFVQLARTLCRQRSDIYFAWIGGIPREIIEIEHDVRLAGLAEKVRLTGAVSKTADYFAAADLFALTSREDPYPLVCLEAAALGKPIVCFAGGGGMPEFVEEDSGVVVPYLDIMAMADCIGSLLDSPERRSMMGAAARCKVIQRHDVSVAAPRILELIERNLAAPVRAS
jgi:glycosyltransferase involved in cell wall biosynthesis